MLIRALTFNLVFLSLILVSCTESNTPEEQIRDIIGEVKEAAENKDIGTLKDFIADTYLDKSKRNKKDIQRILAGYFFRHEKIYLLPHISSITLTSETNGELLVYVAMASTPLPDRNILEKIHADLHRMDVTVTKKDKSWQVQSARWRQAHLNDFFPEK